MTKRVIIAVIILACIAPFVSHAHAQSTDATALTITPPFFQLNVSPGDAWASSIRVVNTNNSDLPVTASVMGFGSSDESGHAIFTPLADLANDKDALANWIVLGSSSIVIPRGQAMDIPFSIVVPHDAAPGGHYAAILIGTTPPTGGPAGSHVGVSSFISSLIFVRVSGDITESAQIQEFSTDKSYYQTPDVNFTLRLANIGNVHLRPTGQITIYNAFGKQVGQVGVNQGGDLGYVLPSSTRRFDVGWQGQSSIFDVGQYSAVVTLAYGEDGSKSVSQTVTFWVVPYDKILEDLIVALLVGWFITYILRRIIRRMLAREISRYGGIAAPPKPPIPPASQISSTQTNETKQILDLRERKKEE